MTMTVGSEQILCWWSFKHCSIKQKKKTFSGWNRSFFCVDAANESWSYNSINIRYCLWKLIAINKTENISPTNEKFIVTSTLTHVSRFRLSRCLLSDFNCRKQLKSCSKHFNLYMSFEESFDSTAVIWAETRERCWSFWVVFQANYWNVKTPNTKI